MINSAPSQARMIVKVSWIPDRGIFLEPTTPQGYSIELRRAARDLLTWDSSSFYGTVYQTATVDGRQGILLRAIDAVEYFSENRANSLIAIEWSPEVDAVRQAAAQIREALHTARFIPDFLSWQEGRPGWRLAQKPEASEQLLSVPYFDEWASLAVRQRIGDVPELAEAWEDLVRAYPLLGSNASVPDRLVDETEWLVAIGFQEDPLPLRTCLQLEEPQNSSEFSVGIVLQDRHNPSILLPFSLEEGECAPYADRVAREIAHWVQLAPWMAAKSEKGGQAGIRQTLSPRDAWRFLTDAAPVLAAAGYTLLLPGWWERARRARARLRAKVKSTANSRRGSLFGLDQTAAFDWRIAVGETEITPEEFAQMAAEKSRLVRFRDQWLCIDPEFLKQMRKTMKTVDESGLTLREVLERYLRDAADPAESFGRGVEAGEDPTGTVDDDVEVILDAHLTELAEQLGTAGRFPVMDTPPGFHGTLRPYQQQGFSWLAFLRRYGLGALLADDMGLGKTVQYIAYLLAARLEPAEENAPRMEETGARQGPALLICPTSVLGNWQKELDGFAPGLKVHLHYGSARKHGDELWDAVRDADLVVTSYAVAYLDGDDLTGIHWDSLCLDEAQNIKNAHTKQASLVRRISAGHRIAMTGTPVENRLTELWSLMDFANPGYLGGLAGFSHRFVQPIEKDRNSVRAQQLQRMVRPFLLRRIKEDPAVELDLPEKSEMKEFVSLSAEQAALYEGIVNRMLERIDQEPPMARRGVILATLTRLKQACNHPALAVQDLPEDALRSEMDVIEQISRSSKLERLVEMVQEVRDEEEQCLIFTQFVQTGLLLQSILQQTLGEPVPFLHGSLNKQARDRMIADFQQAGATQGALILSLKAGGVGLNLTAATHVFHFDRWWNPAVESQATDRAYRIGQDRHVQVHKFVTLGTLEERIDALLDSKKSLSENIVGGGERWITELATDELRELLVLRREWVRE